MYNAIHCPASPTKPLRPFHSGDTVQWHRTRSQAKMSVRADPNLVKKLIFATQMQNSYKSCSCRSSDRRAFILTPLLALMLQDPHQPAALAAWTACVAA